MAKPKLQKETKAVFDHWNRHKGKGRWKSHRELTYDIECAVKDVLKHYTVEQICEAIDNYALVLLGGEYRWSYAWTLALFLTRHRPDDRKIPQFTRFLGNNFVAADYLTKEAVRARIEKRRRDAELLERQYEDAKRKAGPRVKPPPRLKLKTVEEAAKPMGEQEFEQRRQQQIRALKVSEKKGE